MYAMFAVVYKCCRGRAVTNVVRTCSPTPLLKRQLNMFKLEEEERESVIISFLYLISFLKQSICSVTNIHMRCITVKRLN